MRRKILVVMIHGIGDGRGENKFLFNLENGIRKHLEKQIIQYSFKRSVSKDFVFLYIDWFKILQKSEDLLWSKISKNYKLKYRLFRRFVINFFADALAYQPSERHRDVYDKIHILIAEKINQQIYKGNISEDSLVCFLGYSLGSIIASNYIYDIQSDNSYLMCDAVKKVIQNNDCPVLRGDTIASFYTMGSPLALWSLRHENFGKPVKIPSPNLKKGTGNWYNFYDKDDILAYPLKELNEDYSIQISEDIEVKVPGWLWKWNPIAHTKYCFCKKMQEKIADDLLLRWKEINNGKNPSVLSE